MQIQYAVFCEKIDAKKKPVKFIRPISNVTFKNLDTLEPLEFPLFITFCGGSAGVHALNMVVETPQTIMKLPDYKFKWPKGQTTHGEILPVNFEPDAFGDYIFKFGVDGTDLHELTIPIIRKWKLF